MGIHNINFQDKIIDLKLSQLKYYISSYGISFLGLKNEFEIAVVNKPSVFKPLKFYCRIERILWISILYSAVVASLQSLPIT